MKPRPLALETIPFRSSHPSRSRRTAHSPTRRKNLDRTRPLRYDMLWKPMTPNPYKQALADTLRSLRRSLPILSAMLLLLSLASVLIPKTLYRRVFTGDVLLDPLIGALVGSLSAGNPVTSYIIGGELKAQGVSMLAVTAFLAAWVTVGVIQYPAEALMLGRKFAMVRNAVSFVSSLVLAVLTVWTLGYIRYG